MTDSALPKVIDLNILLKTMVDQNASDLHLTVGSPPAFRINGQIVRSKTHVLSPEDTKRLCYSLLTEQQKKTFEESHELDFAFGVKSIARLRANFFIQRGTVAAVFRKIPSEMPVLSRLGFSAEIQKIPSKPSGLVLVTGATGSGKSTTLAAMIDQINQSRRAHIITVEDPIEFTHSHNLSLVNQREIGTDSESFAKALRQTLREDPDVIMVGEMRDPETSEAALRAAETGHLVFSTLHTNGAIATINRIVQMFTLEEQVYIRSVLSLTLEGILSQCLCERKDGKGRVMAYEYLAFTPAIRHLVRENKLHQVYGQMQMGQDRHAMVTLNQSLARLVFDGIITSEEAMSQTSELEELQKMLAQPDVRNRKAS